MNPQRYLALALGATLAAVAGTLLLNRSLDPFALGEAGAANTLTAVRAASAEPFWYKAFAASRIRPRALILGTSRAGAGLDAGNAVFPPAARPAYNLALAGASIAQMRDLLIHAQSARALRVLVIGLDLEAFLAGGRTDFDAAVLAGNRESAPAWLNRLRIDLSWRALMASAERLQPSRPAQAMHVVLVGARGLFQIAEYENFHSRLPQLFPRWPPRARWDTDPRRAAAMQAFRDLLAYARARGIDVRLFISPVHARYLELYRRVGWWPLFEAWKRALVAALEAEAGTRPGTEPFPLWDFSGFNDLTIEALPPPDDLKTPMQWFTDSSHYSRRFGDLILDTVLGGRQSAVGVPVGARNIETHLAQVRRAADEYRAAFPGEVAELGRMVAYLRYRVRR